MFKHSPTRNQRSKGFKIKHALQIALLLAVCIWLIYQVKHSHDKKKAFEESAAKLSERIESQHDIIKFGRKDLNPRVEKTASENERHGEEEETQEEEEEEIKHEEEEEEIKHEEEEEIKHDEEEQQEEEENKPEESENEGKGDGDDEIDEHEQQRTDEEAKREEDFVDEEERDKHDNEEENEMEETQSNESEEKVAEEETKESEEKVNEEESKESAEKEHEEETKENEEETKKSEEKENEKETKEKENQIEEQDHDRNTQEAREVQYKGDDASSAVVRDTQAVSTEGESGVIGISNEKEHVENLQANELGMENKTNNLNEGTSEQKDSDLKVGDGETTEGNSTVTATDGNSTVNATEIQDKGTEINLSELEDGSLPILTTKESIDLQEVNNNSTAGNVGTLGASLQNGTDIITENQTVETTSSNGVGDLDHKPVLLDQTENSNMTAEMLRSDSNSSVSTSTQNEDASKKESEESSSNSGTGVQEEQNAREEGNSKSSTTNENGDEGQNENSETTTEEEDNSSSSTTNDTVDLIDNNSAEDPLFPEVKEAQTDLGTLPEIETEGNNSEDVAAER